MLFRSCLCLFLFLYYSASSFDFDFAPSLHSGRAHCFVALSDFEAMHTTWCFFASTSFQRDLNHQICPHPSRQGSHTPFCIDDVIQQLLWTLHCSLFFKFFVLLSLLAMSSPSLFFRSVSINNICIQPLCNLHYLPQRKGRARWLF